MFLLQCFCQDFITLEEDIALDGYINIKEKKNIRMQREHHAETFNDIWYEDDLFDEFSQGDLFDIKILFSERPYGKEEWESERKKEHWDRTTEKLTTDYGEIFLIYQFL